MGTCRSSPNKDYIRIDKSQLITPGFPPIDSDHEQSDTSSTDAVFGERI